MFDNYDVILGKTIDRIPSYNMDRCMVALSKSSLIFISFTWFTQLHIVAPGTFTETTWQSSIRVNEYKSYGSVRMVEYKVPENTFTSHWYFAGSYSPEDKCDERTILVYLQHGSYPLITPLNETFPEDFYLPRTQLHLVRVYSNTSTSLHTLDNPLPGSWYAAVILGNYVDEKISVKDMGPDCKYYLAQATHIVGILDNMDSILTDTDVDGVVEQDEPVTYRFRTMEHTWQYTLTIDNCLVNSDNNDTNNTVSPSPSPSPSPSSPPSSSCPLRVATRAFALADWDPDHSNIVNCSAQPGPACVSKVTQPATSAWHYIRLESLTPGVVTFTLSISTQECSRDNPYRETARDVSPPSTQQVQLSNITFNSTAVPYILDTNGDSLSDLPPTVVVDSEFGSDFITSNFSAMGDTIVAMETPETNQSEQPVMPCSRLPELGRYESGTSAFQAKFFLRIMDAALLNRLMVSDLEPVVLKFDLWQNKDIGGTLHFDMMLENYLLNASQVVVVRACIQKDSLPVTEDGADCDPDNKRLMNSSSPEDFVQTTLYFPYPEAGAWYISIQATCYDPITQQEESCEDQPIFVQFIVDVTPCVDGGCGENGECREYFNGVLHYSVCRCIGKWRGYACTDDTEAMSDSEQLLAALLLTMSNLFFIPAILISLYKRFWTEALVYFYTMFFSTFYHACDGDRKYIYCMMPFNVLAICDFFGAILSFWVTIITMAKLLESMKTFLFMLGALALVMGVTWDRFSLWTFLVPIGVALGIMGVAWTQRCYTRRSCYPSVKRWLLFLIPGVLVAGAGLIVYAFFETESNYHYTHSTWHACIALCIVFFLPPRQPKAKDLIPFLPLRWCRPEEEKDEVCNGFVVVSQSPCNV